MSSQDILEGWARRVVAHPWRAILAALLLAGGLGAQLPRLELDGTAEAFLRESDPVRRTRDAFREQFGRYGVIAIAVEPPELFRFAFLERLRRFHQDLAAEVPHLEEVTSLVNARHTTGRGDELLVEDFLEAWPRTPDELAERKRLAAANPLYRNYLISDDGRIAAVMLELETYSASGESFLGQAEVVESARALERVVARYDAPDFRIHVAGGPVASTWLMSAMQRDIVIFFSACFGLIALLLLLLFRRLSGVALPLLVVSLSVFATFGAMALAGVAITLPVQVLPSFLLAVGVCDSVHLLTLYYRALPETSRAEATVRALGHSGLAVVMTSLTTAAGLASFAASELAPVRHFGIFGPLGVLFALLFSLLLLPALLVVLPLQPARQPRAGVAERVLAGCAALATRQPRRVVAASAALVLLAAAGLPRIEFSHDFLRWLPEDDPTRLGVEYLNREFQGGASLEVLLDTRRENGLHDPALLARLDALRAWAEALEIGPLRVGKASSVVDVLKEIHQALNENRAEFYAVPRDRRLIAQELLLFENSGSDDLEDVVDSRFQLGSFTLRIPQADAIHVARVIEAVEGRFREVLGSSVEVTVTGGTAVDARTFGAVLPSMARSYALAFLAVTPLMALMLTSLRRGLISMIPNLTPILLTLGLMGWFGFPIDIGTMMIGAIVLGVAVDDTIHFMSVFHRRYRASGDRDAAIRETLATTGRALLFTSVVLSAGFWVLALATMANIANTGILTGFAIAVAFVADVLLAPALVVLTEKPRLADAAAG